MATEALLAPAVVLDTLWRESDRGGCAGCAKAVEAWVGIGHIDTAGNCNTVAQHRLFAEDG